MSMVETNPKKIYIGNLPRDYTEVTLRDDFSRFGQIRRIEFKGRFGFVEFDSPSSATDAVSTMNGTMINGDRIQVKSYHYIASKGRLAPYASFSSGRHHYHMMDNNYRDPGAGRTQYRVLVLGLSERTNWQDLKDFGRKVGIVNYADVTRGPDGAPRGILEFQDAHAMNAALERLSGTELLGCPVRLVREKSNSMGSSSSAYAANYHHPSGYISSSHHRRSSSYFPPSGAEMMEDYYEPDHHHHHHRPRNSSHLQHYGGGSISPVRGGGKVSSPGGGYIPPPQSNVTISSRKHRPRLIEDPAQHSHSHHSHVHHHNRGHHHSSPSRSISTPRSADHESPGSHPYYHAGSAAAGTASYVPIVPNVMGRQPYHHSAYTRKQLHRSRSRAAYVSVSPPLPQHYRHHHHHHHHHHRHHLPSSSSSPYYASVSCHHHEGYYCCNRSGKVGKGHQMDGGGGYHRHHHRHQIPRSLSSSGYRHAYDNRGPGLNEPPMQGVPPREGMTQVGQPHTGQPRGGASGHERLGVADRDMISGQQGSAQERGSGGAGDRGGQDRTSGGIIPSNMPPGDANNTSSNHYKSSYKRSRDDSIIPPPNGVPGPQTSNYATERVYYKAQQHPAKNKNDFYCSSHSRSGSLNHYRQKVGDKIERSDPRKV